MAAVATIDSRGGVGKSADSRAAYQLNGPAERGTRWSRVLLARRLLLCVYMHRVAALPINYLKLINLEG